MFICRYLRGFHAVVANVAFFQFHSLDNILQLVVSVETNPPPSPSPGGYLYNFDFRADQANVMVLARVEGDRLCSRIPKSLGKFLYVIRISCYFQSCNWSFRS